MSNQLNKFKTINKKQSKNNILSKTFKTSFKVLFKLLLVVFQLIKMFGFRKKFVSQPYKLFNGK